MTVVEWGGVDVKGDRGGVSLAYKRPCGAPPCTRVHTSLLQHVYCMDTLDEQSHPLLKKGRVSYFKKTEICFSVQSPIRHQFIFFSPFPHTVSSRHAPSSSLTRLNNTSHQRCSADIQLATPPRVKVRPPYLAEPMAAHEGKVRLRLAIERKRREGRPIFTRAECPQP